MNPMIYVTALFDVIEWYLFEIPSYTAIFHTAHTELDCSHYRCTCHICTELASQTLRGAIILLSAGLFGLFFFQSCFCFGGV